MSYRDSLPDDAARGRYASAITAAAQVLARACHDQDTLAAAAGTRAVAVAAWYPGHPLGTVEKIQDRYEQMQATARREKRAVA